MAARVVARPRAEPLPKPAAAARAVPPVPEAQCAAGYGCSIEGMAPSPPRHDGRGTESSASASRRASPVGARGGAGRHWRAVVAARASAVQGRTPSSHASLVPRRRGCFSCPLTHVSLTLTLMDVIQTLFVYMNKV